MKKKKIKKLIFNREIVSRLELRIARVEKLLKIEPTEFAHTCYPAECQLDSQVSCYDCYEK